MFIKAPESFYPNRNSPPGENQEESARGKGEGMKFARVVMIAVVLCSMAVAGTRAQTKGNATAEVTALLREFIAGAGSGDKALFERFFADDVIYTRATGVVITKADIMGSLGKPAPASEGKSSYSAEDITVHEYGDTVIVAFRLEGHTEHADGKVEQAHYRNTGTFLRRNGRWQAVAWQATKISDTGKTQ
jgi:ketosteroid isomerase-like protein